MPNLINNPRVLSEVFKCSKLLLVDSLGTIYLTPLPFEHCLYS